MSSSISHELNQSATAGIHRRTVATSAQELGSVDPDAAAQSLPASGASAQEALIQGLPKDLRSQFRLRKPRLCAACMAESGHHHEAFQHIPFTHCVVHGNRLIRRCLYCSAPFDFESMGQRCLECGRSWRWMANASKDTVPEHQMLMLAASPEDYASYLNGLNLALNAVVRPFDTTQRMRRQWPSSDDYPTLLPLAHELLSSDSFLLAYKEALGQKRSRYQKLGKYAVYLGFDDLAKDLRALRATTTLAKPQNIAWPDHFPLCLEFITPLRLRSAEDAWNLDEALINHANLSDVCRIVGIKSDVALWMMRAGIIFDFSPQTTSHIYDINDLTMASLNIRPSKSSALWTLQESIAYCKTYGLSSDNIHIMVLTGEIPVLPAQERMNLFDGILLDAPAVIRCTARRWQKSNKSSVHSYTAAKMLFVREQDIDDCVRLGFLKSDNAEGIKARIKTESIASLSRELFFPVRYATIRRKKSVDLRHELRKMGFNPIIGHSIFPRSPEIVAATKKILTSEPQAKDRRKMKLG